MTRQSPAPRRLRTTAFVLVFVLLLFATALALGEAAARLWGETPWVVGERDIRVEPGGSMFETHPTLGYQLRSGRYDVTLETGYRWVMSNDENRRRATHRLDVVEPETGRDEIWILGCSFAYGYAADDSESVPWILQSRMRDDTIVNLGVPGYGTIHALVQMREALAVGQRPKVAVIAYFDNHDERNTFDRHRRKLIATFNRLGPMVQPYARLGRDGRLSVSMADSVYTEWPLMRYSALVHGLEQRYNAWDAQSCRNHEVTKAILAELDQLCRRHQVKLIVAGMSPRPLTQDTLAFCRKQGILATDISFDWDDGTNWNWPGDPAHPSPAGYEQLATNLECYLKLVALADDYRARMNDNARRCDALASVGAAHLRQCRREQNAAAAHRHLQAAVEQLQQATRIRPVDTATRMLLADALASSHRWSEAVAEYREVLKIDPNSRPAAMGLAWLLSSCPDATMRDPAQAVELARRAIASKGEFDPVSHYVLAETYTSAGQFSDAVSAADEALKLALLAGHTKLVPLVQEMISQVARRETVSWDRWQRTVVR